MEAEKKAMISVGIATSIPGPKPQYGNPHYWPNGIYYNPKTGHAIYVENGWPIYLSGNSIWPISLDLDEDDARRCSGFIEAPAGTTLAITITSEKPR